VADVFLSYGSADREQARRIAASLTARDYDVWWDRELVPGADFTREIERELAAARVVIVLWSPRSVDSPWVRDEAAAARDRGALLPVSLEGQLPPLGFRQLHALALGPASDDPAWSAPLLAAVGQRLAGGPAGGASAIAPPTAAARARPRRLATGLAAALALGALAAVPFALHRWHQGDERPRPAADAGERAVAVLPFQNLNADANDHFLGLGIAEIVLNRLAASRALLVVARSSSFAFENRNVDAREIGRVLGARYLVQGSVQHAGERLRVTAQVVDAASGRQLRALSFDRRLADLFAVQDEIATQVAMALDASAAPAAAGTSNLDAQLEYLRGLEALGRYRAVDAERAIALFAHAQALDPRFAAPLAAEARARQMRAAIRGEDPPPDVDRIAALAERAIELDPSLGQAYVVRGTLRNRPPAARESDLRRGIELAPSYADGYMDLAVLLADRPGTDAERAELIDRAVQVDPMQPRPRYVRALERFDGDPVRFEQAMVEVLALDPDFVQALNRLSLPRAHLHGQYAEAVKLVERSIRLDPGAAFPRRLAYAYYLLLGDLPAARDVIAGTPAAVTGRVIEAVYLGDRAQAASAVLPPSGQDAGPVRWDVGDLDYALTLALVEAAARDRDPTRAIARIESGCPPAAAGAPACLGDAMTLVFAESVAAARIATGDRAGGDELLRRILSRCDEIAARTPPRLFAALRARALALLGRHDEAMAVLERDGANGPPWEWWILLERDPAFDPVRNSPRFAALLGAARAHARGERERLEVLRRAGEVPRRPAG
jgi:TolB-like protein